MSRRVCALVLLLASCSAGDRAASHPDQSTAAPQRPRPPPLAVVRIDIGNQRKLFEVR